LTQEDDVFSRGFAKMEGKLGLNGFGMYDIIFCEKVKTKLFCFVFAPKNSVPPVDDHLAAIS